MIFPKFYDDGDKEMWWNPADFHWHFWRSCISEHYEFGHCKGASNYYSPDIENLLMGGDL